MKEPELKLFGRKIQLLENAGEVVGGECSDDSSDLGNQVRDDEAQSTGDVNDTKPQVKDQGPSETEASVIRTASPESDDNPTTLAIDEDIDSMNKPETKNENIEAPSDQQKTLKKPDKILPCPRCNSTDTKFCYYNNYNTSQPRHFCRSCQRYWTAGGTVRNVPVGSGRRKSKSSARIDVSNNGFHHPTGFDPNGTVLSFNPDSPLCQSMASALNLAEKGVVPNGVQHGYCKVDHGDPSLSCNERVNKDDCSVRSTATTSSDSMVDVAKHVPQKPIVHNINGFTSPPIPCIPSPTWPLPYLNGYSMPVFYYPPPYWNCTALPINAWNLPWLSVPNQENPNSGPNSPLGKHSRNGELINKTNSSEAEEVSKSAQNSIVVPKTLRIDDPEEAVKSSIWETLGIKYDSSHQREGLLKALQPKVEEKKSNVPNSSTVLQANPAALSRSISFQEGA